MVSGEFQDPSFPRLLYQIYKKPRNQMGNIYIRYSDPIDMDNFTEENRKLSFRELAMKLTK